MKLEYDSPEALAQAQWYGFRTEEQLCEAKGAKDETLLAQVTDALYTIARALDENEAFVVSDLFLYVASNHAVMQRIKKDAHAEFSRLKREQPSAISLQLGRKQHESSC